MFEMGEIYDPERTLHTEPGTGRVYYRERTLVSTRNGSFYQWEKVYLDEEFDLAS